MRARDVLGRDLKPGESKLSAIKAAMDQEGTGVVGTCACIPQENNWKAHCVCRAKNFLFRIGLIKGANGILFISKGLFNRIGGYDESISTFEHADLIRRALAHGGKWIYLQDVYVEVSMRRYERNGYFKTLFWWAFEAIRYSLGLRSRKMASVSSLEKKQGG